MKTILFITLSVFLFSCHSPQKNTVEQTLSRAIGDESASKFELTQIDEEGTDWFEISVKKNKVHVKGNSPVALCKGAYHYIMDNGYGVVAWEGANVNLPSVLTDTTYARVTSSVPLRMYVNPCTYGYTMAWWDWARWEKELDWMAMHGINMPLALLGQEIIWQQVWEEMGIDKSELSDYHCGPAFLAWFRMGNIYNHVGPLPQSWMDKDEILQKKIMNRMKALGMKPIVPAFSGHVPPAFVKKYPNSKIYELKDWGGLEAVKASHLLDPKDSLFSVVGELFLQKYEDCYGKADLFLADAFNEMLPPVSEENKNAELADYGEAIYKSIKEHNPKATWVIQGWTFGHQSYFWNSESTKSFFSKIPKNNLLMLNYGEDRYPIWEKLDAFYGYKWTYGYVHNYGGQQSLFGDLNFYHDKYVDLINNPKKANLVGYGCLPEAIENNSIVYDYIFDVPWGGTELSVTDWVNRYISNRYMKLTPKAQEAWRIALANTYTVKEWRTSRLGYGTYIHNNRPSLGINIEMFHGNPTALASILELLLADYNEHANDDLYYYDILDFAQHYTAYLADAHLVKASDYIKEGKFADSDKEFAKTKEYLRKLEVLQVATGGSFTKWCEDAVALATTDEERALYLENAKMQITLWGGNRLKDYASKSWSGILMDFYVPRWQMLFDAAKEKDFDEKATQEKIRLMEEEWVKEPSMPISHRALSKADYLGLVHDLLQ